jgi:hypothetical protein
VPTKRYPLEPGGPERLEVLGSPYWRDAVVRLDDHELGTVSRAELRAGKEFLLSDGSVLLVRLAPGLLGSELHVLRDGEPVSGGAPLLRARLRAACLVIFAIAALSIVVGLVAHLAPSRGLQDLGFDWRSVVFGVVFFVFGALAWRGSAVALGLAIALYVVNTAALLPFAAPGDDPPLPQLTVRILLLVPMVRGFLAARALRRDAGPRRPEQAA